MKSLIRGAALATMMAQMALSAIADEKKEWMPNASRGQQLAENLCASCHVVRPDQTRGTVAGVPTFSALMQQPNHRIASAMIVPHSPMPDMQLTRNEIADIIAYIEELRRKAAGKPPADTTPREKPKYPSRS